MNLTEALAKERAAFRDVVRWRALYSRMRPRMAQMDFHAARDLHAQLKDAEYAAIEAHKETERDLDEIVMGGLPS